MSAKRPKLLDRAAALVKGRGLARLLNLYPPYLGAGVRVREIDSHTFDVSMRLRPWNQNYFGTHFGGSLYSMCDPFFALILARELGPGYVVWDKAAAIRFVRPGKGRVHARFSIPRERVREIRAKVDGGRKDEPTFSAQILDEAGEVVAEVDKHLYVRKAR
ncbi:MAG TPA: YiiD C-terminal domain-containing protein [Myxococcales bacterium]